MKMLWSRLSFGICLAFASVGCSPNAEMQEIGQREPVSANTGIAQSSPAFPDESTADRVNALQSDGERPAVVPVVFEQTTDQQGKGQTAPPREKLFEGWKKPDLAIVVTGRQAGYIEPCGCTGLENQKGGLMRRHTLLKKLRGEGSPTIAVDVGNQVRRFGRQPEIKFQRTVDALKAMKYQAVGFGPDDLKLTFNELFAAAGKLDGDSPFVCANVTLIDAEYSNQFLVVKEGGKKIGITSFLGKEHLQQVPEGEITTQAPATALAAVWPQLKKEKCDLYVLLAHGSLEESRAMARQFPGFDIIVTAGGAGEPTNVEERIQGTQGIMIQTGTKGMYVGVIGVYFGPQTTYRYQRVPLDSRFKDSPEMLRLFKEYQEMLKTLGLKGLGLTPIAHPSGNRFVGSQACQDCHEAEYDVWHDGILESDDHGPHTRATASLVNPNQRSEIPRHFDPECLSCHVTGWNPQKYFPYVSGYLDLEASKHLHMNGCENCHGPGSAHVAAEEEGGDDALVTRLREQMRRTKKQAETQCMECHDHDNSPDFHVKGAFEKYWERVEH